MTGPLGLTYRTDYWDDAVSKQEFKRFLVGMHGLDLDLWDESGFWDPDYRPFSLFDGTTIVSSLCLYSMTMRMGGRTLRVGQVSGVGTLAPLRRKGLSRWLTDRALQWAASNHEGFFLFADDDAVPFYRRLGFLPVTETSYSMKVMPPPERSGSRQLDLNRPDDLDLLYRTASERAPVSDILGVLNPRLLMFHCLYDLRDHVHFIPDLDVIVVMKTEGERLVLFDVLGKRVPSLEKLHPYISGNPHSRIEFQFVPDKMKVREAQKVVMEGSNAHRHPSLAMPSDVLFPYMSHA